MHWNIWIARGLMAVEYAYTIKIQRHQEVEVDLDGIGIVDHGTDLVPDQGLETEGMTGGDHHAQDQGTEDMEVIGVWTEAILEMIVVVVIEEILDIGDGLVVPMDIMGTNGEGI